MGGSSRPPGKYFPEKNMETYHEIPSDPPIKTCPIQPYSIVIWHIMLILCINCTEAQHEALCECCNGAWKCLWTKLYYDPVSTPRAPRTPIYIYPFTDYRLNWNFQDYIRKSQMSHIKMFHINLLWWNQPIIASPVQSLLTLLKAYNKIKSYRLCI